MVRQKRDLVRGLDAVSVFAINGNTGEIERIQTAKHRGGRPRGCAVSPDERYPLVALTMIGKVTILAIAENGTVARTGWSFSQPGSGDVTFFPAKPVAPTKVTEEAGPW